MSKNGSDEDEFWVNSMVSYRELEEQIVRAVENNQKRTQQGNHMESSTRKNVPSLMRSTRLSTTKISGRHKEEQGPSFECSIQKIGSAQPRS